VGGEPFVVAKGEGAYLTDVDGNRYLDYVCSWGPLIFGHADPATVAALSETLQHGTSFGCPTERELELCRLICDIVPSVEMVRLVNSGTEAAMSALRLARGYTGRNKMIKFRGCYHGHVDSLLVQAGSGLATLGTPSSAGVPEEVARDTILLDYNDIKGLEDAFARFGSELAGVMVEPIGGNMGCVPPIPGFLERMRELCTEHGALLVFDEVMTGFRVALGGAQERYGVTPDMTAMGKIIGGGLPVGAYGGKREVMEKISPLGPVYQAGTLSGNPLATTGGLMTLRRLAEDTDAIYGTLEARSAQLEAGLRDAAAAAGVPLTINRVGSMMTPFITDTAVTDFASAAKGSDRLYGTLFHSLLEQGVYMAPSRYECAFMSTAHSEADVEATCKAARVAFEAVAKVWEEESA